MKDIDGKPVGPFSWPIERRYEYAIGRANKLVDQYPLLAEIWLKEADRLLVLRNSSVRHDGIV